MQPATLHRRAALGAAVCTALFLVLLALVATRWGPLGSADRDIVVALHHSAVEHRGWTKANRVLTDWVWDPWTMRALLAVAVGWLLWRREWQLALWVAVTAAAGTALQQAIKAGVDRARPQWPDPVDSAHYAAFPSGHALTTTVTFGLLLWLMTLHRAPAKWLRALAVVAAVSVLGVGFTRLYLGVHWPSDVLAGWLLGAALVYGAIASYGYAQSRTGEREASPGGSARS
ncbi:phosphatase PAP2 family protein [Streptomyces rugosispiralis]|uniref:Phosphatase PAP2 family protein n=1 Tax=Streptomyces rugosispiralis TaxID=2967341 RepID=A0ABT1USD2_9ACTN|nr:phosphatase PAP2 family protein [Streptomyces rugosispiralis]MCQ8188043.1 phosphatase PAP2 family protein [Streptomyces rugosispiralis]